MARFRKLRIIALCVGLSMCVVTGATAMQAQSSLLLVGPDALIDPVAPAYPPQAIAANHKGAVQAMISVRPDGTVDSVTVVKSSGYGELDEAVVTAVKKWRFKPGALGSIPNGIRFRENFSFDPVEHSGYTDDEISHMTECVSVSDEVQAIAVSKLLSIPQDRVKEHYEHEPSSGVTSAVIEKVYGDSFQNSLGYAISFFGQCAQSHAKVAQERVRPAMQCDRWAQVASIAYNVKLNGKSQEDAYAVIAGYTKANLNSVVGYVYGNNLTRSQAEINSWNACMHAMKPVKFVAPVK